MFNCNRLFPVIRSINFGNDVRSALGTRQQSIGFGHAVNLERVVVDGNLLAQRPGNVLVEVKLWQAELDVFERFVNRLLHNRIVPDSFAAGA